VASDKYEKIQAVTKENVNECRSKVFCKRNENINIIKSIVVMRLFILSTIQGSWLGLPSTLPILWMDGNSDLTMPGDKGAAAMLIGLLG